MSESSSLEESGLSPLVEEGKVARVLQDFHGCDLNRAEKLVAATRFCVEVLKDFRKDVAGFRKDIGDAEAADFARHVLNDLIYDLQDMIPPTVRAYNALLRDLEQKIEPVDE